MPEDKPTGQASKQPEPKPEPKPSPSEEQGNEGKVRGKYVNYQELSKDELVKMLMRVNKRLTRINRELKEIINILYYGNTQAPQEGGGQENQGRKYQNSGYRNYRRNYSGNYRQYGYKGSYRQRRSDEDEDVNYD